MSDSVAGPAFADDGGHGQALEDWTIDITNDHGSRTYVVTDTSGQQRYAHEEQLPGWVVRALGREWLAQFAQLADGHLTWSQSGSSKNDDALAAVAVSNSQAWQSVSSKSTEDSKVLQSLRDAWRVPLEQRAALVADTATYAVRLLDSLQKEIAARSAVVQALAGEVEAARTQAEHAAQLARLNEEQAAAVNAFLDRLLAARLGAMERHARRREWVLATVVALIIGVASILVSHYLAGF
jgi:hypothetical protein